MITVEAKHSSECPLEEIHEAGFKIPSDFGEIGAVIVENHNEEEMYVKQVELSGLQPSGDPFTITISCNSWVQPKTLIPDQNRVFFTNKVSSLLTLTLPINQSV